MKRILNEYMLRGNRAIRIGATFGFLTLCSAIVQPTQAYSQEVDEESLDSRKSDLREKLMKLQESNPYNENGLSITSENPSFDFGSSDSPSNNFDDDSELVEGLAVDNLERSIRRQADENLGDANIIELNN